MSNIRWGKSKEGFIKSKCGRFHISPRYWGHVKPQCYALDYTPADKKFNMGSTYNNQKDAKKAAERMFSERKQRAEDEKERTGYWLYHRKTILRNQVIE